MADSVGEVAGLNSVVGESVGRIVGLGVLGTLGAEKDLKRVLFCSAKGFGVRHGFEGRAGLELEEVSMKLSIF